METIHCKKKRKCCDGGKKSLFLKQKQVKAKVFFFSKEQYVVKSENDWMLLFGSCQLKLCVLLSALICPHWNWWQFFRGVQQDSAKRKLP